MTSSAFLTLALYLLATSASHVVSPRDAATDRPTVTLSAGPVAGTSTGSVNRFLGVPFAAPPVRFDPPQPAPAWNGTYDASQLKPACFQEFNYPENERNWIIAWFNTPGPPAGESEDCLYLNVFAPAGAGAGSKAVMFWLFWGAYVFGTGTLPRCNGSNFAKNQDVVVAINYRTSLSGFPGSPEKPRLLDQQLALDWVQQNIRPFGGDPARVTLFSESAGAFSIDALVTSLPSMPPPFHGAILESGQYTVNTMYNPAIPKSATSWPRLVLAAGCGLPATALSCMRTRPETQLKSLAEHNELDWSPIYDGKTVSSSARIDRLRSTRAVSRIARVPILIGSNADEGAPFAYGQPDLRGRLSSLISTNSATSGILAGLIDRLPDAYPNDPNTAPLYQLLSHIITDLVFQCPARLVADETARVGIPSWRYYYNSSFANAELFPGSGAYHTSEIAEVYGTYPRPGATPYQAELSASMQKAWADFAKNPAAGPGWAPVPKIAVLGAGVRPGGDDGTEKPTMTVQYPTSLDRTCPLFQPLYDVVSLPLV